jgi:hypothetical protein
MQGVSGAKQVKVFIDFVSDCDVFGAMKSWRCVEVL